MVFLSSIPWGFHNDEVDVAYVGKYLVMHGRDPAGNFFPLSFNKFGDFRPIGLFYLVGITEFVLGANEFAARLPSALFGALLVWPVFLLSREIFKRDGPAYLASFFLAILPWDIVLSRAGHEVVPGHFVVVFGFYFLFRFVQSRARKFLIYSFLFLFSSYFFYYGTRFLVPALLLATFPFAPRKIFLKLGVIFLLLTALLFLTTAGKGRSSQVVFYKNPGMVKKLTELTFPDKGNIAAARIFHNKVVVYGRGLIADYSQYFSPDFLFLRGGYPERYLVTEVGLLYIVMVLPIIFGFCELWKQKKRSLLPIAWLFASPLPAIFTYEDIPSMTRASFMMVPLVMLAGFGLMVIFERLRGRLKALFAVGFIVVVVLEMLFFGHQYIVHQKVYKNFLRDDGMAGFVSYINEHKDSYDQVMVPLGPNYPFYYLFYNNIFDSSIKIDLAAKADFRIGNVVFIWNTCPSYFAREQTGKVLYIDGDNCLEKEGSILVGKILRADGTLAFNVRERKNEELMTTTP